MTSTSRQDVLGQWIRFLLISSIVVVTVGCMPGASAAGESKSEPVAAPAARISEEQATRAALQVLPGKVTDVTIEKKRGKNVYVIEILAEKDGAETDVLVDTDTGAVLGVEH